MHGYILIIGVALAGILTRVLLLETFTQEDKVVLMEITSESVDKNTGDMFVTDDQ